MPCYHDTSGLTLYFIASPTNGVRERVGNFPIVPAVVAMKNIQNIIEEGHEKHEICIIIL